MKLNKDNIKSISIAVIVLAIYNIIFWAIPFKHNGTFVGAYIFGTVALLAQVAVLVLAWRNVDTLKEKIYAFPIVRMGMIYGIIQLAVSLLFAIAASFIEGMPAWIVCVISAILLGVFAILVLMTDTTREEIVEIEEEEERRTVQVKTFRINIDSIMRRTDDKVLLAKLTKLSETAKYSDPVSSDELFEIEEKITAKINELESAVCMNNIETAMNMAEQVIDLLEDRNQQCKTFKKR